MHISAQDGNRSFGRRSSEAFFEPLEPRMLLSASPYENRGWVSVIVDNTLQSSLTARLAQFKQDLIGDAWTVSLHNDAPRMDDEHYVWNNFLGVPVTNANFGDFKEQYISELQIVKDMIASDAEDALAAGSELKQVILIGHVAAPYSGLLNYDGHAQRAMPTDAYYADLDATPATWGDYKYNSTDGGDQAHELTTNEPGDARFDVNQVPGNAQTVTVSGSSGTFTLTFNGATTSALAFDASAVDVRTALNGLSSIQNSGGFVTVVQSGNVYTATFLGSLGGINQPQMTAGGSAGASVATLNNGGAELGIGRIDMFNLDAAFPTTETAVQFESRLINEYLQRDHEWRTAQRPVSQQALVDPISDVLG